MLLPPIELGGNCGYAQATDPDGNGISFVLSLDRSVAGGSVFNNTTHALVIFIMVGGIRPVGRFSLFDAYSVSVSGGDLVWAVSGGGNSGNVGVVQGFIAVAYVPNNLPAGTAITITAPYGYALADCYEFTNVPENRTAYPVNNSLAAATDGGTQHTLDIHPAARMPAAIFGVVTGGSYDGADWDVSLIDTQPGTGSDPGTPPWISITEREFDGVSLNHLLFNGADTALHNPYTWDMQPCYRSFNAPPNGALGYNMRGTAHKNAGGSFPSDPWGRGGAWAALYGIEPSRGAFIVEVVNPCSGLPIWGIRVNIFLAGVVTTRWTDEDGVAIFRELSDGDYIVQIGPDMLPGHNPGVASVPPGIREYDGQFTILGGNTVDFGIVQQPLLGDCPSLPPPPGGGGPAVACDENEGIGTGVACTSTAGGGTTVSCGELAGVGTGSAVEVN